MSTYLWLDGVIRNRWEASKGPTVTKLRFWSQGRSLSPFWSKMLERTGRFWYWFYRGYENSHCRVKSGMVWRLWHFGSWGHRNQSKNAVHDEISAIGLLGAVSQACRRVYLTSRVFRHQAEGALSLYAPLHRGLKRTIANRGSSRIGTLSLYAPLHRGLKPRPYCDTSFREIRGRLSLYAPLHRGLKHSAVFTFRL